MLGVIICWPGVQGNLEAELEVRNTAISLPRSFQHSTLSKSLIGDDISKKTNNLSIYFHPCLTSFGYQSPLHIIMPCPPSIMAQCR